MKPLNVEEAQQRIAAILAELEVLTGQFVEELHIESVDITRVSDHAQQLQRSVKITLKPIPGSHWDIGQ